jgi:hypothetical protein
MLTLLVNVLSLIGQLKKQGLTIAARQALAVS